MATQTSNRHRTTLTVGGVQIPGYWKGIKGGGLNIEAVKNRPGGEDQEEVISTGSTREDLTLDREYKTERDAGLVGPGGFLEIAAKQDTPCVVTSQDLDGSWQPVGPPKTFSGKITNPSRGDRSSESKDVDTITVVLSVVA